MHPDITISGYLWLNVFTIWVTGIWNIVIPRQLPFITVMCENKIVYATQGHWNANLDIHVISGWYKKDPESLFNISKVRLMTFCAKV
jgi:hypothetical protein